MRNGIFSLAVFVLLAQSAMATLYYVRKDGNDTNTGKENTSSGAKLTVQSGVNLLVAGDSLFVGAGIYEEDVETFANGILTGHIIIDGQGVATIRQFIFSREYNTLKNMTVIGTVTQFSRLVYFNFGAHFCKLLNCKIDAALMPKVSGIQWRLSRTKPFGTGEVASDNLIEGNTISRVLAYTLASIAGDRNTIRGNNFIDSGQADCIRLWGRNNLITGNKFSNIYSVSGQGNHPDFIQTFGVNGDGSMYHIIENNFVRDIEGGQIAQLTSALLPDIGNWVFRNNVFMDIKLQASISIPGIQFYNNVFYRINLDGGAALSFGSRDFTTLNSYNGLGGTTYAHGGKVINNVFLDCGASSSNTIGFYGFEAGLQNVEADYNYVGKNNYSPYREGNLKQPIGNPGGWQQFRWWETNGINGGNPRFVNHTEGNFNILPDSLLIDRGKSIELVTSDFIKVSRPQGQRYDIGAFELVSSSNSEVPSKPISLRIVNLN